MAQVISHDQVHHDHYTERGEHIITNEVALSDIGKWLKKGWIDMANAPNESLFYGLVMSLSVLMVYAAFRDNPVMMFKVATFFVLLSPFLATGLYAVSSQIHNGDRPNLIKSMFAWQRNTTDIALYAITLGVITAIWARITPLIAAIVESNSLLIVNPEAGVMGFLASEPGQAFMLYFVGAAIVLTAFVFSISVVTIPLLLADKNIGFISAMVISFKVTMENKKVMAAWALTIGAFVTLGIVTLGFAMLIVMPLLGYASWHAFKDLVEIEGQPNLDDYQ